MFGFALPPSAYSGGTLDLRFEKVTGYRAVVSQVVLVESPAAGDVGSPVTVLVTPAAGTRLTGGTASLSGTVVDAEGSAISSVEFGFSDGVGEIFWQAVGEVATDGTWTATWTLPVDGAYLLYARAQDMEGNIGTPGVGTSVVVDQAAPAAVTDLSSFDTPGDSGGSITLAWQISVDDGGGDNDVANYEVERRESGADGA